MGGDLRPLFETANSTLVCCEEMKKNVLGATKPHESAVGGVKSQNKKQSK